MSGRGFNLQDYATVDDRITKYWAMHPKPEGSIQTEVIWVAEDGGSVAIRATVYQGERILATGIAQEERGSKGANSTSWWENCETSAIGRALANMDMSLSKNRPSRQEMEKVGRYEDAADPPPGRTLAEADLSGVGHGRRDTAHPPPNPPAPAAGIAAARSSASSTTPQAADYDDNLGWTEFWSWARKNGYQDRHACAVALGKADDVVNGWTPAQIRTALEVAHQRAG